MDPDANLNEQRRIAARLMKAWDECDEATGAWRDVEAVAEDGRRLGELVEALDNWIKGGGFLPRAWCR